MADPPASSNRIVFIHPDLGIGGAERLVVDAAVGLQGLGYSTTFLTSHCDKTHCFDECRDGTSHFLTIYSNLTNSRFTYRHTRRTSPG